MRKRAIAFGILVMILVFGSAFYGLGHTKTKDKTESFGLFSWHMEVVAKQEADTLNACITAAGITEIYQEFTTESLQDGTAAAFVKRMAQQKVSVYALLGSETWVNEPDELLAALQEVTQYNSTTDKNSRLCGVVVDVEPYLLEDWDDGDESRAALMERYFSCMESAYRYAAEQDLFFWACIPTFYDTDVLERLAARCCDGLAVMNYNREDEYGRMAHEVGVARAYDKHVMCIYELQKPGKHELEEINTYANRSLSELQSSWDDLRQKFGYDKLSYAYHYYEPLCELLKN